MSNGTTTDHLTIIRPKALARELGVSSVTLWRLRQRRDIPAPIQISSGVVGWRRSDIEAWLEKRSIR
jgi:predicted DNA-binding transcriptional regulator AlpA